ncbi:MAG: DUF4492 domain-containing protein [Saprospiraceae bacterium]
MKRILDFYIDGFRNMSITSKKLWLIIAIKLIIMFGILKLFFFKDYLNERYDNEEQKSEYIINELINNKN